jgi:hypothetical protein
VPRVFGQGLRRARSFGRADDPAYAAARKDWPTEHYCSKRISFSPAGVLSSVSLSVFSPTVFASLKSLST